MPNHPVHRHGRGLHPAACGRIHARWSRSQPDHDGEFAIGDAQHDAAASEDRSRPLRGGEERADLRGRGNEDRPGQDRVFAAAEGRRRLLLRHLRRQRQHGRARSRPADPSRLDAGCGARDRAGISRCRARRRVHPQRSVPGRLAPARRERRGAGLPRRPPARLRLRARALARHRQRHARQLWRGDRNLRRGPAPAADPPVSRRQAGSRDRGDHLRQRPHPHRTARRSARAGGGELARRRRGCRRWRRNTAPTRCSTSCRRCRTTRKR